MSDRYRLKPPPRAPRSLDVTFGAPRYDSKGILPVLMRAPRKGGERDLNARRNKPRNAMEAQLERRYGLEPGLDRPGLLPLMRNPRTDNIELTMPEVGYGLLRAFEAPGMVLAGNDVDLPGEASNFAGYFTGGGMAANLGTRPVRGAALGMSGARRAGRRLNTTDIRPPSENLSTVGSSNFYNWDVVGEKTLPVSSLNGGVSASTTDAVKVARLTKALTGPDAYWERPIVDQAGNVIEGQHRIAALRQLGITEAPVTVLRDLEAGFPRSEVVKAMTAKGDLHPDQANQLVGEIAKIWRQEGGNIGEMRQYDLGWATPYYMDGIKALEGVKP